VKLHGNAKLTPVQRRLMCARVDVDGWTVAEVAEAAGISDVGPTCGWRGGGVVTACSRTDRRCRCGSRTAPRGGLR
jgi:leucine-zipper of insertion element IS481